MIYKVFVFDISKSHCVLRAQSSATGALHEVRSAIVETGQKAVTEAEYNAGNFYA